MKFESVVRSEPGQYYAESGAVNVLPEKLKPFKQPVIVTGRQSYAAFQKHYTGTDYPVLRYDETASHEDMDRLADLAKQQGADVIVAIGGGKVLDTAKGVAERLNSELVLVPTVAGTCAPVTPVSAVYHPNHQFKTVDYYTRSGFLTLVDYQLLVESPEEYFKGGVTDTLAKWYEADSITRLYTFEELPALVQLGVASARVTREILLRDTADALQALKEKRVNGAFERVIDTVFAVAGYVGCQACEYGRMSGAHAFHNGLTRLHETNNIQHGVKVAYGILVQLCTTGDQDEVRRLLPYYKENDFIYSWQQLGVSEDFTTAAYKVAEHAASEKETFNLAKPDVNADDIVAAIRELEALVTEVLGDK